MVSQQPSLIPKLSFLAYHTSILRYSPTYTYTLAHTINLQIFNSWLILPPFDPTVTLLQKFSSAITSPWTFLPPQLTILNPSSMVLWWAES